MKDAHILTMTADVGAERLAALVTQLADDGLPIVVGPEVGGHPSLPQLHDAVVLLIAVGGSGLPSPPPYPLSRFLDGGQAAVVALVGNVRLPPGDDVPWFDLRNWSGVPTGEYDRMVGHLRALVAGGLVFSDDWELDDNQVATTRFTVEQLQELTGRLGSLGDVLSDDDQRSQAVRQTLAEIGSTYQVVKRAIIDFTRAGLQIDGRGAEAYAALAHGELRRVIHNGRAHCTRIGVRYERVGGLRDGIQSKLSAAELAVMDQTFQRLATADGDLLQSLEQLGTALTSESRVIERMLLTGQQTQARLRAVRATERLAALEDALEDALHAFQDVESTLGYAEAVPAEKEPVNMTNQTITIYGDVVQSNVVASGKIENSSIEVVGSDAREDIKALLLELHKATAAMTTRLPADEAELAASDLETLANEAISAKPRPAFWRRAANGLLDAAKKVAEVGTPVIDLVTKLAALLN